MIRAANTGVTCFINQFGRVTQELRDETGSTFTEGVLSRRNQSADRARADILCPPWRAIRESVRSNHVDCNRAGELDTLADVVEGFACAEQPPNWSR